MCILNVIYSLSCWTHPLIIYPFQAYSLIAGHFCWIFRTCSFGSNLYLPLCLVSAPKLWNYINSCIKTINYIMKLVCCYCCVELWLSCLNDKFVCKFVSRPDFRIHDRHIGKVPLQGSIPMRTQTYIQTYLSNKSIRVQRSSNNKLTSKYNFNYLNTRVHINFIVLEH
jgi:hypothetical protein